MRQEAKALLVHVQASTLSRHDDMNRCLPPYLPRSGLMQSLSLLLATLSAALLSLLATLPAALALRRGQIKLSIH